MSFTKRAFLQGLQRSLIASGAIPPYTSKWQQKHALDQAEEKAEEREEEKKRVQKDNNLPVTEEKEPEELTEDEVSEMMTDIVEAEPLDEAIEALQEYQEAAGDSELASEELAEALEDVKDSKEAALAIRRLKLANSSAVGGGSVGDELIRATGNLESGYGAPPLNPIKKVTQSPLMDLVAEGSENNSSHFAQFDAASTNGKKKKKKSSPSNQEVKAAMAILRKLAGEQDASALGGAGLGDLEHGEGPATPNPVTHMSMEEADMLVTPHPGQEQDALAHLVAKTAREVGHFLPQNLSSTDKLAALRTMVGMNGQERAAYIGRIKEAMYNPYPAQNNQEQRAANALRNLGL